MSFKLGFKSKLKLQPKIQRNVISAALAEWNSIRHIFSFCFALKLHNIHTFEA